MKKNKNGNNIYVYIILFIIFIFLLIFIYGFVKEKEKKTMEEDKEEASYLNEDIVVESVKPFEEETSIKVIINGNEYVLKLENNIAAYDLASLIRVLDTMATNEKGIEIE